MQKVIQFKDAYIDQDFNVTPGQFAGQPVLTFDQCVLSHNTKDKSIDQKRAENYYKVCSGRRQ